MKLGILGTLFDSNEREIKKLHPVVATISALESKTKKLKDTDFSKKTEDLKKRIEQDEKIEDLLPEAFALAREAAHRTIGQRHFDVQLMAATVLASGKISEQRTGEGKTLSAVPALYLHALTGNSVHLVTVNDYLARRDAGWMGPVFHLLGMSVSAIISEQSYIFDPTFTNDEKGDFRLTHLRPISRKEAYGADVVYGINSEFGFDYLRDNMATSATAVVQRGYYFAVVDEVDSVLIDEARTPHIISAPQEEPTQKYYEYAKLVDKLTSDSDYKVDEKLRTAHLTDHGIAKIEKLYGVANIYEKDFDTVYHLEAALKARTLFRKEKDYIVKDNQVILVDEFTGRLMVGRRLSEGLHQAIEAKENVPIQRESKILATVSLQNYFRMYERLAGMTGTAATESEEFHKIYKLDVVAIPTHRPMGRKDLSDSIYKTGRAKMSAVANAVEEAHKLGQPVLVGTTSIEKNEIISQLLRRRGVKHEVLNAKNHEKEAEIIAKAGELGAVTVATNMAGRGVDIILGGESPKDADGSAKQNSPQWKAWEKNHKKVLEAGGLFVIGTERHESRRIDNQLRGRSGRQGDPGASRFFVSLDDDIMRLFGGDTIANIMTRFNMPEDVPLEHAIVSRAIEQAQGKVEGFNFDIRKHLVEYDDVLNKQREIIYRKRRRALDTPIHQKENEENYLRTAAMETVGAVIDRTVSVHSAATAESPLLDANQKIVEDFTTIIPFDDGSKAQLVKQLEQTAGIEEKETFLKTIANDVYKKREEQLGTHLAREVERFVLLSVIDNLWTDHLDAIENVRQGIGLRGYGQRDPLVEYKNEAFHMFEQLAAAIDDEISHRIYKVQIQPASTGQGGQGQQPPEEQQPRQVIATPAGGIEGAAEVSQKMSTVNSPRTTVINKSAIDSSPVSPRQGGQSAISNKKKLGRNDPCWCGSGKKWKKCHYPKIA